MTELTVEALKKRPYKIVVPKKTPTIITDDYMLEHYPKFKPSSDEYQYWKFCLTYQNDTPRFCKNVLHNKLSSQQADITRAVDQPHARVLAKSAHGTGKTFALGNVIIAFMATHPLARVMCTSGTQDTLRDVLLPEISNQYNKLCEALPIFDDWFSLSVEKLKHKYREDAFIRLRSVSKEKTASLAGQHVPRGKPFGLLWVVEEISSLADDDNVFDVIFGSLTTGENNRFLGVGNPTATYGFHYKGMTERTDEFTCLHFNSLEAPEGLISLKEIKKDAGKYGTSSMFFIIRRMGDFCHDYGVFLIQKVMLEACIYINSKGERVGEPNLEDPKDILTVDVAGEGTNEHVLMHKRVEIKNNRVTGFQIVSIETELNPKGTSFVTKSIRKGQSLNNCPIVYDKVGVGEYFGRLLEEKYSNAYAFIAGKRAMDKTLYKNLRAEGYGQIQLLTESIEQKVFIPYHFKLIEQLSKIPYRHNEEAQLQIFRKEVMKEKFNLESPDHAECTMMGVAYAARCKWEEDYDENVIEETISPSEGMYE